MLDVLLGEIVLALGRLPTTSLDTLRLDTQRAARGDRGVGRGSSGPWTSPSGAPGEGLPVHDQHTRTSQAA
eukprot:9593091-Karenia_brevis.AAC.1